MLGEGLVDLPVLHRLLADHFLQLVIDELGDHDQVVLDDHCLPVELVLPEHPVDCPLRCSVLGGGPRPEDIVAVESVVLHAAIGAHIVADVDVFALDGVLPPLG